MRQNSTTPQKTRIKITTITAKTASSVELGPVDCVFAIAGLGGRVTYWKGVWVAGGAKVGYGVGAGLGGGVGTGVGDCVENRVGDCIENRIGHLS